MTCEDFENQFLGSDHLESATGHDALAKHLAGCERCRAFARRTQQLDLGLTRFLKTPALSAAFETRLQQRIKAVPIMSEAEKAERKRQLQAEYEAGLARLKWFLLPPGKWLDSLGYAAVVVLTGRLLWLFMPRFSELIADAVSGGTPESLLLLLAVSAVFLFLGLLAAFPGRLWRLRFS
jgi:hypothetical protein